MNTVIAVALLGSIGLSALQEPQGAINPAVTQINIHQIVCVIGWTKTVRPPEWQTYQLKRRMLTREYELGQSYPAGAWRRPA
jgi:hypothetical protein